MKYRTQTIISLTLLCCFTAIMMVLIYSNIKLKSYHETLADTESLLLTWKKSESLTKELLITYDLKKIRAKWLASTNKFEEDFEAFLHSPATEKFIETVPDFELAVALTKMHWKVRKERLKVVDRKLQSFLTDNEKQDVSLQAMFGFEMAGLSYSPRLLDAISAIRWSLPLSDFTFSQVLSDLRNSVTSAIDNQIRQLKVSSAIIIILIVFIAGFFILFRVEGVIQSREMSLRHTSELAIEIEERKHTEKQLRSERDKLNSVMNAFGDGMYIVNNSYTIEYQNDVLNKMYGDLKGRKCYSEYYSRSKPCEFCYAKSAIQNQKLFQSEALYENINYEVTFSPFKDVDRRTKTIVLLHDITEKKRLEAETIRAGHLASIGELAAGVAHEINNPISSIISMTEIIRDESEEKNESTALPERILKQSDRVAKIVSNLLSFAHEHKKDYLMTDLTEILSETFNLMENQLLKDHIQIIKKIPENLPKVKVRAHEIQQVFLNLISNARYALNYKFPDHEEAKILEIQARLIKIDNIPFVQLIFYDNGQGISEENLEKICNPFFTTKPTGIGTGLGLSISHGIIKKHNGTLSFQSSPGEYTRVFVELPADII
ncbi:MAG: hypothetical protein K9L30_09135 [Desulfobacterales bacterium]|nr:hypothetical protein [Desulfobacterales bacterium]